MLRDHRLMALRSLGPIDPDWPVAPTTRASVIVAEDDVELAMTLAERLVVKGYQVTTAEDGELAVDMMTLDEPTALVVDLHLPKRDGFEVAAYARRLRGRNFPIVAISGDTSAMTNARAHVAGCDFLLAKPFSFETLCEAIERLRARGLPC